MFGKKKRRTYDDDDGRTIASMNVEGMPGYNPARNDYPEVPPQPTIGEDGQELPPKREEDRQPELLSGKALRRFIVSATLAGLVIALIFVGGAFLFIQFCLHVWLH